MPHQRKCSKSKVIQARSSRRLVIPIGQEEYECLRGDTNAFRSSLDQVIEQHPQPFPAEIKQGYRGYGLYPRSKTVPAIRLRRIRLSAASASAVFTIAPSFVL